MGHKTIVQDIANDCNKIRKNYKKNNENKWGMEYGEYETFVFEFIMDLMRSDWHILFLT